MLLHGFRTFIKKRIKRSHAQRNDWIFGLNFIKTNIVSPELGKFYSQLFELRQTGDYDDWKIITETEVMALAPKVELFLDTLEKLIYDKHLQ